MALNSSTLKTLLASAKEYIKDLKTLEECQKFREELLAQLQEFDPAVSETMSALVEKAHKDPTSRGDLATAITDLRDSIVWKEFNAIKQQILSTLQNYEKQFYKGGRSNRSKRAKRASDVFTRNAGLQIVGDPNSTKNDLCEDGAFDGLYVFAIQQYSEGRHFEKPIEALRGKGFYVEWHLGNINMSDEDLAEKLSGASQFWFISSNFKMLTDTQIEIIYEAWSNGLGIYIFGDNDPFYVDANRLLKRFGLPQMSGNYHASKTVKKVDDADPLLWTGIVDLPEGVTIAEWSDGIVDASGCKGVMRNSRGIWSVIMKEPQNGFGRVICDGAFTKLYCNWGGQSARFVRNCACLLSTLVDGEDTISPVAEEEEDTIPVLNWEDAPQVECSILATYGTGCLLVGELADAEQNTSDVGLDNPLAFGKDNVHAIGSQVVSSAITDTIMGNGSNPFTRQPVVGVLPLVVLAHPDNYKILTHLLCKVFMGGAYLPKAAWLTFLAVLEEMTHRQPDNVDAILFMIDQIMTHVTSTATFTEDGDQLPLKNAMIEYGSTDADSGLANLKKLLMSTCTMACLVLPDIGIDVFTKWIRHALIKAVCEQVLSFAKQNKKAQLTKWFYNVGYKGCAGIVFQHTGKSIPFDSLPDSELLTVVMPEKVTTVSGLNVNEIITPDQTAVLLFLLCSEISQKDMQSFRTESLLRHLFQKPVFKNIWNGEPVDANTVLDEKFRKYYQGSGKHTIEKAPPFVSCFGASVTTCMCGHDFTTGTEGNADKIRVNRNTHFEECYHSSIEGNPTDTSAHAPLHMSIIRVMTRDEFKTDTNRRPEHVVAVLEKLLSRQQGFIYHEEIVPMTEMLIDSFLESRKAGLPEPSQNQNISFVDKLALEQKLRSEGKTWPLCLSV